MIFGTLSTFGAENTTKSSSIKTKNKVKHSLKQPLSKNKARAHYIWWNFTQKKGHTYNPKKKRNIWPKKKPDN